jgi:hypothetical protein
VPVAAAAAAADKVPAAAVVVAAAAAVSSKTHNIKKLVRKDAEQLQRTAAESLEFVQGPRLYACVPTGAQQQQVVLPVLPRARRTGRG